MQTCVRASIYIESACVLEWETSLKFSTTYGTLRPKRYVADSIPRLDALKRIKQSFPTSTISIHSSYCRCVENASFNRGSIQRSRIRKEDRPRYFDIVDDLKIAEVEADGSLTTISLDNVVNTRADLVSSLLDLISVHRKCLASDISTRSRSRCRISRFYS